MYGIKGARQAGVESGSTGQGSELAEDRCSPNAIRLRIDMSQIGKFRGTDLPLCNAEAASEKLSAFLCLAAGLIALTLLGLAFLASLYPVISQFSMSGECGKEVRRTRVLLMAWYLLAILVLGDPRPSRDKSLDERTVCYLVPLRIPLTFGLTKEQLTCTSAL